MKRAALIFVLAVFLPALILGGLALRSARDQQVVLEQQAVELRQQEVESLATVIRAAVVEEQQAFKSVVARLLREQAPGDVARRFNQLLQAEWRGEAVGFSLTGDGRLLSPIPAGRENAAQAFLQQNETFLEGREAEEVYQAPLGMMAQLAPSSAPAERSLDAARVAPAAAPAMAKDEVMTPGRRSRTDFDDLREDKVKEAPEQLKKTAQSKMRNVAPQRQSQRAEQEPSISSLSTAEAGFPALTRSQNEGILARFVQDELEILFWVRGADGYLFGARLKPANLQELLDPLVAQAAPGEGATIALLDDRAQPFARSGTGPLTDPSRPFVAAEIGEVLPHWEAALYLDDPDAIGRSAAVVRLTLASLTAVALGAIAWGGFMIVRETRRQMLAVQKKTDFVSNVSHELKTPLTSIRMFSELLVEGKVTDPDRRRQYLRIISLEAERLTRLINNVLDFARLERKQRSYKKLRVDLKPTIERVWESQILHLQDEGYTTQWDAAPGPYPVVCDADAMAQVLVNLLSNAEKYGGEARAITLQTYPVDGELRIGVLDRGPGVPRGETEKIFEEFYRAHDSLSSGIQGSGLGLALARRMVEDHGGTLGYASREGGGSAFTLKLPLAGKLSP